MRKAVSPGNADPFDAVLKSVASGKTQSPLVKKTTAKPKAAPSEDAPNDSRLVDRLVVYLSGLPSARYAEIKSAFSAAVSQVDEESDETTPDDEDVEAAA